MIKPSVDLSAACDELAIACGFTFPSFAYCCASAPTLDGAAPWGRIGEEQTVSNFVERPESGHLPWCP